MPKKNIQVKVKNLTKGDLVNTLWRNTLGLQLGRNYPRMQGLDYAYAAMSALKRLYKDRKDKMKQTLKLEIESFNTTPQVSHLIVGTDAVLQDELGMGDSNEKAIAGLKTSSMGPFAGVGDTAFVAIYNAIIHSITAYLALSGQPLGLLIPVVGCLAITWIGWKFFNIGLSQGQKLAFAFSDKIDMLTEGASVLGLTVVGGAIPALISYKVDLTYKVGKVIMSVQSTLDKIMPALLPLAIALFLYWVLGKKHMNSTRLIFVLIGLGMILGNLQPICNWIDSIF